MGDRSARERDSGTGDPALSRSEGMACETGRRVDRRSRSLVTDGGSDAESEESAADEPADGSESEAGDDENDVSDDETDEEAESESEEMDESDDETDDQVESEPDETDEEERPTEDDDAVGVHSGDAEAAYESDDTSGVLHLDLDGLALDLLGLEVNLNEVTLDVSARPGENNLLGNLLSGVTGLLDGLAMSPLEALTDRLSGLKDTITDALPGSPLGWVRSKLGGFRERLPSPLEGREVGDGEESEGGFISSITSSVRGALGRVVSALPLEDVIAVVVRAAVRGLVRGASEVTEEEEAQPEPDAAQSAEAQS
ncbi:hypothetical protein [Natronobiforma cellulositropha]|uniref:hypothetical protein n=1 Tax=Natronobiforma cellulositropha TaxID=1679076 RepID=UPI0021D5F28F|nr:hypothetical protein [Natronobiforma cellulositropha]